LKYLGGKFKVCKEIASVINKESGNVFLEPFMGSCWVTAQIKLKHRLAGDLHDEVVEMYHSVKNGWIPPDKLSKEEYDHMRANRCANIYPKNILAFAAFGCAFAGSCWRKYAGEEYAAKAKKSILKKAEHLKDVRYFHSDYRDLKPRGCVIYCDPPYANVSYGFRITGTIGNGKFDTAEFWDIMNKWAETNSVYVSEYNAPDGFDCVMQKAVKSGVRTKNGHETRTERLFHKGSSENLLNIPDMTIEYAKEIVGIECFKADYPI
jgi:DNA adenine methylase